MQSDPFNQTGLLYAKSSQNSSGMSILPLFRTTLANHHYISLREALGKEVVEISEISQGGSVPFLKVTNRGDKPVLMVDGEELIGAKQNRVLNTTVIIPPMAEIIIPVSCTEHGRWHYKSKHFQESGEMLSAGMKSSKLESVTRNVKESNSFRSDQSRVWDEIALMQCKHDVKSQTGAMHDVFKSKAFDLDKTCSFFPCLEEQCGIYVQFGGAFQGLEFVSLPSVWKDVHNKVIRSYAIELINQEYQSLPLEPEVFDRFLINLQGIPKTMHKSAGWGDDIRFEDSIFIGSALLWEEEITHLVCYPRPEHQPKDTFRMLIN